MKTQGDTKRPHSVNAEFDPNFAATSVGGGVLIERTLRRLGVRRLIGEHLPNRSPQAKFTTTEAVYALMAALLLDGRGIGAAECLREDDLASEIFGLGAKGAPSPSTMYRVLCNLSGLPAPDASKVYQAAGPRLATMDMFGHEAKVPRTRRIVPDEAEAASPEHLQAFRAFVAATARRCHQSLATQISRLHGWWTVFGDGTDLEVEGNCFDAARKGRKGEKIMRWLTLMVGPLLVAQELMEGNRDEGRSMPALLEGAGETVREMVGRKGKVLGLFDAAYFEREVIERMRSLGWDFIVCANQLRDTLAVKAKEINKFFWTKTGPDAARGWAESEVGSFVHWPAGWSKRVNIVARRWREEGDLPDCWHYSFLGTSIEPHAIAAKFGKKTDYASAIWMLYGTKQGRENHYKTPLIDLNLHHPPSCRLGVDQAFYAIAAAASNIAMVLRYAVVKGKEKGIELWRFREKYVRIAGYLVRSARRLTVRLSGVCTGALRQTLWQAAFAEAGRL